jgi:hypothetical protein
MMNELAVYELAKVRQDDLLASAGYHRPGYHRLGWRHPGWRRRRRRGTPMAHTRWRVARVLHAVAERIEPDRRPAEG